MHQVSHRKTLLVATTLVLTTLAVGCGIIAQAARAVPKIVPAAYPGLKGKTVGVMVWSDQMIRLDYPSVQNDICASLLSKLQVAQEKEKPAELKDANLKVVSWQSMARYQQDNPSADTLPIAEVAKEVGVERLIYIEISRFQTRSDLSPDLALGRLTASVKVIEYDPVTHTSKVGFQEGDINIKFPAKAPDEGITNLGDQQAYVGTIKEFTSKLAWKFYKHEEERQPGE